MISEISKRLRENIQKVIVGKDEVINLALTAVLCEGHILLEDVPGSVKRPWRAHWRSHLDAVFAGYSSHRTCYRATLPGSAGSTRRKANLSFDPDR